MEEGSGDNSCKFLSLPTELLVVILSFLPSTRDKVKIRYVSHRLRSVIETPSLWRTFVWPYYDDREELCINNVLEACGKDVKKMIFPHHVAPSKLVKMLQQCSNVTHLSLPEGAVFSKFSSETELRECLGHMEQLKYLYVHWQSHGMKTLLSMVANCEELAVHLGVENNLTRWVQDWVENGYVPKNLSFYANIPKYFILAEIGYWSKWNTQYPVNHTATLRLYRTSFVPVNHFPLVPIFQLQYGPTAALPFTSASKFGLSTSRLGVTHDLLLITDNGNNVVQKGVSVSSIELGIDLSHCKHVDIKFLTRFQCRDFLSGHLEQLAIACPNLQQLSLQNNFFCLKSLQGLRSIAHNCKKLQGLNLLHIYVSDVENQVYLWEILSDMKLTHLAVDLCIMKHDEAVKGRMSKFMQCLALQGLEMVKGGSCSECEKFNSRDLRHLSHFPMLCFCKLTWLPFQSTGVDDIVTSCNALSNLYIDWYFHVPLPLSGLSQNCALKQLCLTSRTVVVSDEFMETVSAHGGLEHVIILAQEITFGGIIALVKNSPKLVTLRVVVGQAVEQDGIPNLENLKTTLIKMFPHRVMLTMGTYQVEENRRVGLQSYGLSLCIDLNNSSLWPPNYCF